MADLVGSDKGELKFADSYGFILNADGTCIFTEEWTTVNCSWLSDGNTVTITDGDFTINAVYENGYFTILWEGAVMRFNKN